VNPLRKVLVHQGQADRILRGVQKIFELVELAKDLKRSCQVLQGGAGVAIFHAPNRIDRSTNALSQGLLGQLPASSGQGYALSEPEQSPFNWKRDGTALHYLSPKFGFLSYIYV
jgi:hypothetical protein